MTENGWRACAKQAVEDDRAGDPTGLDLLARLLKEQDEAKQALRDKGYGCTGMPWLDVVAEVPTL